jgi:pSer/pThr/pTyr-binding forkhead associated (FHA) protein
MPSQLKVIELNTFPGDAQTLYVGQVFDLVKDAMRFGRHSNSDIPLYSFDRVRNHGFLLKDGENHYVEDISDRRGQILVNNTPLKERTLLRDGDVIAVHLVKFVYLKNNKSGPDSFSSSDVTTT